MKFSVLIAFCFPLVVAAQSPAPPASPSASPTAPAPVATSAAPTVRSATQLDTLLGPIALYPDALVALILPAATTPADIVLAARTLGDGTSADVASQPWDDSVKGLVHYPDLLRWLDQNLTWTQALGEAFASQPADVMNAVQRLRQRARAAGTLVDTPQQQVIAQDDSLLIQPVQRDVIYVPVYDPAVVYVSHPTRVGHHHISFRSAYRAGPWLCYAPDWRRGNVHVIHHRHYRPPHVVHHSPYPGSSGHVWSPRIRHPSHTRSLRPDPTLPPKRSNRLHRPPEKPAQFYTPPDRTPPRRPSPDSLRPPRQRNNERLLRGSGRDNPPAGFFDPDSAKRRKK